MAKELFSGVTGRAKWACTGLLLIGLLWGAIGAVTLDVTIQDGADGVREYMTGYFFLIAITALIAMTLLIMRQPAGRIVAWIALPFVLILVPIGTAAGVCVILGLHSEDMRNYLKR